MKIRNCIIGVFAITMAIVLSMCRKNHSNGLDHGAVNAKKFNPATMAVSLPMGSVSCAYGMLHFSNKETFCATMDSFAAMSYADLNLWETQFSGFTSLRKAFEAVDNGILEEQCDDDDLGTVLNTSSMVWIDTTAFLLDWAKDSIYEVYPVNSGTLQALQQKKEIADNDTMYVFRYSLDDEVLYPVTNVTRRGLVKWWKKIFNHCLDKPAPGNHDSLTYYYNNSGSGSNMRYYKYKCKIKYQRAGIYFSLVHKVKHYSKSPDQILWYPASGKACAAYQFSDKVTCGAADGNGNGTQCSATDYNADGWKWVDCKWRFRVYSSMRTLTTYHFLSGEFLLKNLGITFSTIVQPQPPLEIHYP